MEMFSFKVQTYVSMVYVFQLYQHFIKSPPFTTALCQWNCGEVSDLNEAEVTPSCHLALRIVGDDPH